MPNRAAAVLAIIVALSSAGHAQTPSPQSWPGLWGPARNGESPVRLAATPPVARELWRRPVAGGYSEIAVASGHAVTMELRAGADFVVALDPATGREQWSTRVGPTLKGHDGSDDGPIATPAIAGAEVFAVGPHGHLVALDVATGSVRWRHDLAAEFGAAVPAYGFAASPLVEGDLVIVPTGGPNSRGLLAFNRTRGRLIWNAPHAKTLAYSSAVAAAIGGVRQIVAGAGDRIFAVSPGDGRLLWSVAGPGADKELATSPIVLPGDRVLYSSWDETVMLKVTREGDALSARELWRTARLRAYNGPTIYRDGFLYGVAGPQLVCLDAETAELKWRERTGEGTLVALGPHMLLLGQTSGDLRLVRASPDGYSESLRTRVFAPDVISATGPTVAGGRVYLRNLREMAAFSF